MNTTLSGAVTLSTPDYYIFYSNNKSDEMIPVYTYNEGKYARAEKNEEVKWFKVEPIRWRVTDYGVTTFPTAIEQQIVLGNTDVVSDKVLYFGSVEDERAYEGWDSTGSDLYNNMYNIDGINAHTNITSLSQSSTVIFDKFKETPNQESAESCIEKEFKGLRVVSEKELNESNLTDKSAYATDFAAFMLDREIGKKVDYWTRSLSSTLAHGRVIASDGQCVNKALNRFYGVRFANTIKFNQD